jgi:hypothetical protein
MTTTTKTTKNVTTTVRATGFPGDLAHSATIIYFGARFSAPGATPRAAFRRAAAKARRYWT